MSDYEEFMRDIFERKDFLFYLFNCAEPFSQSELKSDMENNYDIEAEDFEDLARNHQQSIYLAKHTNWLMVDKDENFYGTFQNVIVKCDGCGIVEYFCENFEDIPTLLWKSKPEDWRRAYQKHWIEEKNIDIIQKFQEYDEFCEAYHVTRGSEVKKYVFDDKIAKINFSI